MKELLQKFIYSEKLLEDLYAKVSTLTGFKDEKDKLLQFSAEAKENRNYLDYLYKREYGTNYDPIIPDSILSGNYEDVLNELIKQELEGFTDYKDLTHRQDDYEIKETMNKLSDQKLNHIIQMLQIVQQNQSRILKK